MKRLFNLLLALSLLIALCAVPAAAVEYPTFRNTGCFLTENYIFLPGEMTVAQFRLRCSLFDEIAIAVPGAGALDMSAYIPTGATLIISAMSTVIDEYTFVLLGDTDCDGCVTAADSVKALRIAADIEAPALYTVRLACDVDSSASETVFDARSILRSAAKLDDPSLWFSYRTQPFDTSCVLVVLNEGYRRGDGVYDPAMFDGEMVSFIQVIFDVDGTVILKLNLKEPGVDNAELLIRRLNDNPVVSSADKNGYFYGT